MPQPQVNHQRKRGEGSSGGGTSSSQRDDGELRYRAPPTKGPAFVSAGQQARKRDKAGTRREQERLRRRVKDLESGTKGWRQRVIAGEPFKGIEGGLVI